MGYMNSPIWQKKLNELTVEDGSKIAMTTVALVIVGRFMTNLLSRTTVTRNSIR